MTRNLRLALFVLLPFLVGCIAAQGGRDHADFEVGMERSEIVSRFGPPDSRQTVVKTTAFIWGPIEDFWPRVPDGAKVETWSYESTLSEGSASTAGSTELYFVDDSQTVDGIGFAVEGAVYEASP